MTVAQRESFIPEEEEGIQKQSAETDSEVSEFRAKIQKHLCRNREKKEREMSACLDWGDPKSKGPEESGT